MLNEIQIKSVTDTVMDIMKKHKNGLKKKGDSLLPEYHSTYTHSVEMKQAIEIHAVPGKKPDKLVSERAPNQTDAEFNYALSNYQQTTLPVFLDSIHTMQRAFSDNNWMIDYRQGDDKENDLQEYLEQGLKRTPLMLTYEEYMFQVVPSLKMMDAMGCIAYEPHYIPTIQTEAGEVLIDGKRRFEPIPVYYPCESIVAYEDGVFYMFLTEEKSLVEWGGKTVSEGIVFKVYDDAAIWRVEQYGKQVDYTFRESVYYSHELGEVPVDRLKGIPAQYAGKTIFQSLFLFATPNLNDVILDSIMLRSVKATSVFPYRVMVGNICDNTMTIGGEIQNCSGTGWFRDMSANQSISCPSCMGSGMKDRISPQGVLLIKPETAFKEGELKASQPAMYYVSPSVDTPQFIRSEIDSNTNKARQILHLKTSDSQVKGSEDFTATGMALDEKAKYSVIKMFSDQVFDLYESGIRITGRMRLGEKFEMPVITRPITFDFSTEYDYMERISMAVKNGLPSFVVYEIVYRFIKSMFYNEADRAGIFDLIINTDRLLVMPYEQINIESAKGTVQNWEVVLHDSAITIVKNLIRLNPSFLDQDVSVQRDQLIAEAQRMATESTSKIPTASGNVIEAVLRNVG